MGAKSVIGALVLCAARPVGAERAIVVDATGAPLASRELVDAIRARVAVDGAPVHVRVTAIAHGVRVEARGGARELDLDGLDAAAATRLVALTADDLLLDDLATPPAQLSSPPRSPRTLAVVGTVSVWDHALAGVTVDLALPRGAWLGVIDVGAGQRIGGDVHLFAGVVRAGGGLRAGWLELRAGATLVPVVVTSGAGDQTLLVGAGASARVRAPISGALRLVLAVGADAFATRTRYETAGVPVLTTPRLAPWLGVGVEAAP